MSWWNDALTWVADEASSILTDAAAGAAAGSIIPGIGTIAGAIIGGVIGAITGAFKAISDLEAQDIAKQQLDLQKQSLKDQEQVQLLGYQSTVLGLESDIQKQKDAILSANADIGTDTEQAKYYELALSVLPSELAGAKLSYEQKGISDFHDLLGGFSAVGAKAGQSGQEVGAAGASVGEAAGIEAMKLGMFTGGSADKGTLDQWNPNEIGVQEDASGKPTGLATPANGGTYAEGLAAIENQYFINATDYSNKQQQYLASIGVLQGTIATATSNMAADNTQITSTQAAAAALAATLGAS